MIAEQRMLCERTGNRGEHHVDAEVFLLELPGNAGNRGARQHAGLDLPAERIELTGVGADVLHRRGPCPLEQGAECTVPDAMALTALLLEDLLAFGAERRIDFLRPRPFRRAHSPDE